MKDRRHLLWIVSGVLIVVFLAVGARLVPTWQVRNGSAQVAGNVLDAGVFDAATASVVWDCNEYVATVDIPELLNHYEYTEVLSTRFIDLGFERINRHLYHREREDSLDFDVVSIDQQSSESTRTAIVHMTVFDIDSSFCVPNQFVDDPGATDSPPAG